VPSTPPFSGRVIYDKNENIAETSEKKVQSEHTLYTMHTQGVKQAHNLPGTSYRTPHIAIRHFLKKSANVWTSDSA